MRLSLLQKAIVSIFIAEGAGIIGSLFTFSAIGTWYAGLNKPFFSPPNWIFGPAWTILYALMGVAAALVWDAKSKGKKKSGFVTKKDALAVYGIQLLLNVLWSLLFFGLRSPYLAVIEITALWVAVAATIFYFNRISRTAAILLVPYILWVSFAAMLNYSVWMLN
ncbi:MAG: tryptophan-rich sensory protein [Candidatus Aenigmarchaeota archaeon]|nr:tryptophan-rich sensory protein [Candidatus Aenigmarchaeota archaeon]